MPPPWRVGCSTYIWSQQMDLKEHFERVGAEIKGAGFEGTECMASVVQDAGGVASVRRGLAESGLVLAALYVGGAFHDPQKQPAALEAAGHAASRLAALGSPGSVLIWGPEPIRGRAKNPEELQHEAAAAVRLSACLDTLGYAPLCIHNHTPELLEDGRELDALLQAGAPERIGLNLDLEWCVQAGRDPVALLRRFGPRIKHIHLRNSKNKVWSEHFGEGAMDYPRIAESLREIGYAGWLMLEDAWDGKRPLTLSFRERAELGREAIRRWFGV